MKRRFLFMLMAALTFVGANAAILRQNNFLAAGDATAEAGKTVEVNILMTNNKDIINWQTNLVLPEGVTLVKAEAADKWTENVQVNGNTIFSETQTAVGSNQAAVVAKITLQVAATVAVGDYEISLDGTIMTASDATSIQQVDKKTAKLTVRPASTIKGDVDGNGSVGVGDIEAILDIMAGGENKPAADVDNNGSVGVGDIEAILVIMAGGE
jgi:hypothetical protein